MATEAKKENIDGYTFGPVLSKELRKHVRDKAGKGVRVSRDRKKVSVQFSTYNYFLGGIVWCLHAIHRIYEVDITAAEREVYKVRRLMAQKYLDSITARVETASEQQHPRSTPRHSLYRRDK